MTSPAQADTTDSDASLASEAIGLELAAAALYDAAVQAGADGPLWSTFREQHESFAERLAGIVGQRTEGRDSDFAASFESGFRSADPAAAAELENTLAAFYADRLGAASDSVRGRSLAGAMASILASASRQAVLMSGLAGVTDLEALYVNPISEA